jgi:hypothetical protein
LPNWHFVARAAAPAAPKTWGEMTDAEKGALLLAHHEGKVIEWNHRPGDTDFSRSTARGYTPVWAENHAYRVRPEPKRETVTMTGALQNGFAGIKMASDTHRITLDVIDGRPDVGSIKMEEL